MTKKKKKKNECKKNGLEDEQQQNDDDDDEVKANQKPINPSVVVYLIFMQAVMNFQRNKKKERKEMK